MEEHHGLPAPAAPMASAPSPSTQDPVMPISRPASTAPAPTASMIDPISRPASTSTQASAQHSLPQLPGISSLQSTASAPLGQHYLNNYQQSIVSKNPFLPPTNYTRSSPASTAGPGGNTVLPTCQNCATSTTPLWRRDEMGSVLCNACGLFLKLHGRPRPISLKTDVIKSRNRVKTSRNELAKQKKAPTFPPVSDLPGADNNGGNMSQGTPGGLGGRRPSGRSTNGHGDENSPISRNGTPNMYNMVYPDMDGSQFQAQPGGIAFAMSAADGRVATDLNGEHPPTAEALLAENASLKTRVSELEVIQELYRGRLQQLEQAEATAEANARQTHEHSQQTETQLRTQLEGATQTEAQLREQLEESHHRENMLKRRLDELELELKEAKGASDDIEDERPAKKARLDDATEEKTKPEPEDTPQASS